MNVNKEVTREEYLEYRQANNQGEILRIYFNRMTKYELDTANFFAIMFNVLEDHPGLQEDIDALYPKILTGYDKTFHINFLTQDFGDTRVLKMMY